MSRSNKTEDPILPLAHNPILNSAAPGTEPLQKVVSSSSADKHTDDNDTDPPNESQTRQSQSGVEEKNDCFFKVIDISFDGTTSEVKGECYTESRLEEFYQTVPDQTEYTIRVILDGRSDNWWQLSDEMAAAYPLCRAPTHSLDRECPLYSSGILGPHGRWHLPTLRKMLDEDTKPRWYMAASSTYHGFLCQEKGNIDTTWKDSWMGYRYMRSEACWAFDHRRINENKIICMWILNEHLIWLMLDESDMSGTDCSYNRQMFKCVMEVAKDVRLSSDIQTELLALVGQHPAENITNTGHQHT